MQLKILSYPPVQVEKIQWRINSVVVTVDDPTAGISSVEKSQKPSVRYNLAGQKVGADYKGVVIENGKKIVVK